MQPLTLRQLRILRTVLRATTVTEAARHLAISQPAVSKTIREIESGTGLPLFTRVRGRLRPTAEAERLLEEIERLLGHHERIAELIGELRDMTQGKLVIAAIPTLAASIIAEAAARLRRARHGVEVRLESHATARVIELVARQEVDLGFVHGPVTTRGVLADPLCASEVVCLLPRGHPLARLRAIEPRHLVGEEIVSFTATTPHGWAVREALQAHAPAPIIRIETNISAIAGALVQAGAGIALMDPYVVLDSRFSRIIVRPFRPTVWLRAATLHSPYRPMSRLARHYMAILHEVLAAHARSSRLIHLAAGDPQDLQTPSPAQYAEPTPT